MHSLANIKSYFKEFSKFCTLNSAKFIIQETSNLIKTSWTINDISSAKNKNIDITYAINSNCEVISQSHAVIQNDEIIFDVFSHCGLYRATCFERKLNESQGNESKGNVIYVWNKGEYIKSINLKDLDVHGLIYKSNFNFGDVQWLVTGTEIIYLAESKKAKQFSHFQSQPQNKNDNIIGDQYRSKDDFGEQLDHVESPQICVLDVVNEKIDLIEVLPSDYIAGRLCVHPKKEGFIIMAYKKYPYQLGMVYCIQRCSELFYYDIASKKIDRIGSENKSAMSPRFSPDGKYLLWLENDSNGPHMQCQRMMCYDWDKQCVNTVVDIVRDPSHSFPGIYNMGMTEKCWHIDSRHVFLSSLDRGENKILVIDVESKLIRRLEMESGYDSVSLLDMNSEYLLVKVSSPTTIPYLAVSEINGALEFGKLSLKTISRIHKIDDIEWTFLEHVPTFEHPKYGTSHYRSILVSPKNIDKTPLILALHGGPHSSFSNEFVLFFAAAARLGFSSLLVNYRGSWGCGQDVVDSLPGYIGTMDVSDCINACEDVLQRFVSKLDSDNVFLYGGSHGGFLAAHLSAKYGERVRAMACRNPVTNLPAMLAISDIPDWVYTEAGLLWDHGNIPSDDQLLTMWAMSPMRYVKDIKCPVMIMIGQEDRRVPPSQGKELARALLAMGVPCEQHIYPKDSHPLSSVEATSDCFVNILTWFTKYMTKQ